jgi:hypothetical protein
MAEPAWLDLFEPAYADNVEAVLREDIRAQGLSGDCPRLHVPLRSHLLEKIDAYIADTGGTTAAGDLDLGRLDVRAAVQLWAFVDELANRIETCEELYSCEADELRDRWREFVAQGGAIVGVYEERRGQARLRRSGANTANSRFNEARTFARNVYRNCLAEDPACKPGAAAPTIVEAIAGDLGQFCLEKPPALTTVTGWIRDLAPKAARGKGRPRKIRLR